MTTRPALRIALLAGLALPLALAGCGGHGQYTQEHLNGAQEKMVLLKSGTEWKMAQQQFLAGELDKAIKSVDSSISMNPGVTKAHVLRGRILIEKGNLDQARMSFEHAIELDKETPEPRYYLGIIHERLSKFEEALACYEAASTIDPNDPQALIASCEMLVQLDRMDEAELRLAESRSRFEYNAAVRQSLGHIAVMRRDNEKAVQFFNEARLLAPDDATILEDLLRAQISSGHYAEAEFNIGRITDKPTAVRRRDLEHLRARCLVCIDRPVEAREILIRLTSEKDGSGDVNAWIGLGNVAALLNDMARLRTAGNRVIAIAPERYEGYFLKALYLHANGQTDEAVSLLQKATRLPGASADSHILMGLIQQDRGELDAARTSFKLAVMLDPTNIAAAQLAGVAPALATHPDGQ
ncbi:MAG: tetratricopeptide repeat protein [Phycisphaerales bacterium]|nr:tetratricopeptide repeat protein [Phycisphaerales bacterium]